MDRIVIVDNLKDIRENMNKNIGVNAILNTIRSCMALLFPLITYPYAARVLGVANLGKINYGNSIVVYFSLIAALGINTYSVRTGSRVRDNKEKITIFSSQIFSINLVTTFISYILLITVVIFVPQFKPYRTLILIQGISFILTTFGVDWINTIYEDYYIVTIRSLLSYVVGVGLLFIFVKNQNDYYKYAIIQLAPAFITAAMNWFYCKRYVKIKITKKLNLGKHIKSLLTFFANAVAVQIYVNIDTTMLGWMKGDYAVGLYAMSVKIYTIIKNILLSIYTVTIPRLSHNFGIGDYTAYKKLMTKVSSTIMLLLLPAGFGIIAVADEIITLIGGQEYSSATLSLQILGIALIFAIFGGLITAVLNVSTGRESENLKATLIGASLNAGLNIIVIPKYSQNGAAFTTLIAELIVFLFCFIRYPEKSRFIDFKQIGKNLLHGIIGSASIIIISILFHRLQLNIFARLLFIVGTSMVVYVLELLALRNDIVIEAFAKMKGKYLNK